ncbi:hypothetical protein PoB_003313800 [Plakobranchus ocellatus]|uniref:Transposase IS30-like HTH domain-containing protein n=1 Tax=Plakobranchus ocellatus TaxID=259542 RepID=A0AAV4AIL4_9GAST|nr:hypothetical protein PoB_003313800 [Plakobranchus ocellatus]
MPLLSADERGRALGLIEAGVPVANVARLLNGGRETINNPQTTCMNTGRTIDRPIDSQSINLLLETLRSSINVGMSEPIMNQSNFYLKSPINDGLGLAVINQSNNVLSHTPEITDKR